MPGVRRVLVAVAAAVGVAVTLSLGFWQWDRAQQKLALHEAMAQRQQAAAVAPAEVVAAGDNIAPLLHRPIRLRGEWLPGHTVYLDNRQMNGKPGFYVVTPLRLVDAQAVVLVQRGWLQRNFAQRDQLPPLGTPTGVVEVQGRLAPPPAKLYAFASEEKGSIRQNLDIAAFRTETGLPLLQLSVQQTGAPSEGLLREWPQASSGADKNIGYAVQWWALAALIAILYVWFQHVVPHRKARSA
jgi:surfeit locus 1 family protein